MFTQTFVNGTEKTKKPLTILLSLFLQVSALVVLILIPLIYTQTLPGAQLKNLLVAPGPPLAAMPKPPAAPAPKSVRRLNMQRLVAPTVIPNKINVVTEAPAPDIGVFGSNGTADSGKSILGLVGGMPDAALPSAPPAQPKARTATGPVRISSGVSEANLIHRVQPVYPQLAKSARIQGTVEFRATISKQGKIENLQLLRGHPLLVAAARDAVLEWKYRPTLLNGQPVEVVTDIVVNFELTQ